MGFNDLVRSVFAGATEARKENYYPRKFREMETSFLFGVDELEDMLAHAKSKDQCNLILDHMYRFDATRVDYYKDIENKIIDRMWPK